MNKFFFILLAVFLLLSCDTSMETIERNRDIVNITIDTAAGKKTYVVEDNTGAEVE